MCNNCVEAVKTNLFLFLVDIIGSDFEFEFRMALANHRLVKDIESIALITHEEHTFISSSTVKEIAMLDGDVSSMVPPHVHIALKNKIALLENHDVPNAVRD